MARNMIFWGFISTPDLEALVAASQIWFWALHNKEAVHAVIRCFLLLSKIIRFCQIKRWPVRSRTICLEIFLFEMTLACEIWGTKSWIVNEIPACISWIWVATHIHMGSRLTVFEKMVVRHFRLTIISGTTFKLRWSIAVCWASWERLRTHIAGGIFPVSWWEKEIKFPHSSYCGKLGIDANFLANLSAKLQLIMFRVARCLRMWNFRTEELLMIVFKQ